MNKKIIGLIGAAVLVMAMPLQGLAAADAAASLRPVEGGAKVSLDLHQAGAGEGVNALQMSFTLNPVSGSLDKASVSFDFDNDLAGTVKRYSFDQNSGVLTVYVAGANGQLFDNDKTDLGSIQVKAAEGEYLELDITTGLPREDEDSAEQLASGLSLLRAGSSKETLTMQAETLNVNVGEVSPDPEPTEQPEATQKPEATQQPEATQHPETTQKPSGGSNQNGSNQSSNNQSGTAASATAQPGTAATSKTPGTSSTAQSAVSESASEESQAQSESGSSEAQSQAAGSESQAQSQSTASQTEKSKVSVLPVVIGIVVVAAAVVAGVVIWRRGRD